VKPWFAGRIDYSPPVYDLASAGFPLAGGRLDFVEGRKVSVLVYQHGLHKLALTLWPSSASGNVSPEVRQREGFSLVKWRRGGFELRAVSDMAPDEMASFAKALDQTIDANP
jgi:anti-sigma factor RsiW